MDEIDYGAVYIISGRHRGRVLYYDDDETSKTAICYVGHPVDFCGAFDIPKRFLRVPTIDELLKRRGELWRTLTDIAVHKKWDSVDPDEIHALWAEKSLIMGEITDRQLTGALDNIEGLSVFLCHSSKDKGVVRMIHDDLKARKVNCWLDENKIKVGDSIVAKISEGLKSSATMLLFLSPDSVNSLWTKKEWQAFLSRQLSGHKLKILPALLEDCAIPEILSDLKYADFRKDY